MLPDLGVDGGVDGVRRGPTSWTARTGGGRRKSPARSQANASSRRGVFFRVLVRASSAKTLGVRFPGDQRGHHRPTGDADDVGGHDRQLQTGHPRAACPPGSSPRKATMKGPTRSSRPANQRPLRTIETPASPDDHPPIFRPERAPTGAYGLTSSRARLDHGRWFSLLGPAGSAQDGW
jgi:hypothetical protein